MPGPHSQEVAAAVIALIASGATRLEIAAAIGVGREFIRRTAKAAGVKIARGGNGRRYDEHREFTAGCKCRCPSPEEIAERSAVIREGWTEATRRERWNPAWLPDFDGMYGP